jgi:acetyl-CoA C-acetyltransferase
VTLDARTPVIVGVGQYLNRAEGLDDSLEPVALMERAVLAAADDAQLDGPPLADSVRVVNVIGWRYRNAPRFLAGRLGQEPRELAYTTSGGNSPQSLVNRTALDIQSGDLDVAILAGGEAFRTYLRARRSGATLDWAKAPDDDIPTIIGKELAMVHEAEQARTLWLAVQFYPMFETALRAAAGRSVEDHQQHLGRLWSDLSRVAVDNPHAWIRGEKTPEEIATVTDSNRMIGFPYPKYMNSNNDVDMGAALIMCSVGAARRLGIPDDRWVFPHSGTDCHEHNYVSNRHTFTRTPAVEVGGSRALELAGLGIDDIELIDLYSCFPSAVQLGAQSLGIDLDRQWSRTGGLTFAGGPWNNYPMHAIATVVGELRERPDAHGFVWANGGFATKHSFGVYSCRPPARPFAHDEPQAEIDALPFRQLAPMADAAGPATIEAYTVMFSREAEPEEAIAACLLPDGRRAWGMSTELGLATAMCEGEWVGVDVALDAEGMLSAG